MTYIFSNDWFSASENIWPMFIPLLPERKKFLEIGSFEGRSTVWTVEHMMEDGGIIRCIDTWKGGEEHQAANEDMVSVKQRFLNNIAIAKEKFPKRHIHTAQGSSAVELARLLPQLSYNTYDFIYIDGSHKARDVLTDACMAWHLLKPEGVLVFDDYLWGDPRDALHRPKIAIDAFTNIFGEELTLAYVGHQLAVRKNK